MLSKAPLVDFPPFISNKAWNVPGEIDIFPILLNQLSTKGPNTLHTSSSCPYNGPHTCTHYRIEVLFNHL